LQLSASPSWHCRAQRSLASNRRPHCSPRAGAMHSDCAADRSQVWKASVRACEQKSPRPARRAKRNMTPNRKQPLRSEHTHPRGGHDVQAAGGFSRRRHLQCPVRDVGRALHSGHLRRAVHSTRSAKRRHRIAADFRSPRRRGPAKLAGPGRCRRSVLFACYASLGCLPAS
jgi:hypothetical protein